MLLLLPLVLAEGFLLGIEGGGNAITSFTQAATLQTKHGFQLLYLKKLYCHSDIISKLQFRT